MCKPPIPPASARVFVSYTLRDGWISVQDLSGLSSQLSAICHPFVDVLHNRGNNRQRTLVRVLLRSSAIVACVTPKYYRSPWVQYELWLAQRIGLHVIPIVLPLGPDGMHPPSAFETLSTHLAEATARQARLKEPTKQRYAPTQVRKLSGVRWTAGALRLGSVWSTDWLSQHGGRAPLSCGRDAVLRTSSARAPGEATPLSAPGGLVETLRPPSDSARRPSAFPGTVR